MKKLNNYLHLKVQKKLQKIFPQALIEKHFKHHIADVYLEKENIIFEVQCSHISIKTALKRMQFYASIGLTVVWIFHEKICSKHKVGATEKYLQQNSNLIYTNVDQSGRGIFYIQHKYTLGSTVMHSSPAYEIELSKVKRTIWKKIVFPLTLCAKVQQKNTFNNASIRKKLWQFYATKIRLTKNYYTQVLIEKISL